MFVQKIIVRAVKRCGALWASQTCAIVLYSTVASRAEVTAQAAGFKTQQDRRLILIAAPFIK
jgi:hypothetical protein